MIIDPRINRPSTWNSGDDLSRLQAAPQVVALLLLDDPVYAPLFERLENEIRQEEDTLANGAQARARALLARSATGLKTKTARGGMPRRSANHPDHNAHYAGSCPMIGGHLTEPPTARAEGRR